VAKDVEVVGEMSTMQSMTMSTAIIAWLLRDDKMVRGLAVRGWAALGLAVVGCYGPRMVWSAASLSLFFFLIFCSSTSILNSY
jgi:hypothetical protein